MSDEIKKRTIPIRPGKFSFFGRRLLPGHTIAPSNTPPPSPQELEEALRQEESEARAFSETDPASFPLRGSVLRYDDPTGSVAEEDWEAPR